MLVRDFDDRFGWAKWSFPNCAEWLAWRCSVSMSAAREKIRTAHALRELPVISAAFADGRLSYTKARALTRVANTYDEDLLARVRATGHGTAGRRALPQIRNSMPDSAEGAHRIWQRRSLSCGAALRKASRRSEWSCRSRTPNWSRRRSIARSKRAKSLPAPSSTETAGERRRSMHWSRSRGLILRVALATRRGRGSLSGRRARHEAALHGGVGRSDLPVETVKRLTCDGSLITVVEDHRGTPLDVGRKQRTVSTPLKRALWSRDRGCTFPGCHRAHFVDAHHLRHWINGGDTSLENLTLLCTHHHRLLHEGGFR